HLNCKCAFEKTKGFVLAVVDVRRRPSTRRDGNIGQEKGAAGLFAGNKERHQLSRPPVSSAGSHRQMLDLAKARLILDLVRILQNSRLKSTNGQFDGWLCHLLLPFGKLSLP